MPIAVLVPGLDSASIGERQAGSRLRGMLAAEAGALRVYDPAERASDVAADLESHHVLVFTDPWMLPGLRLASRLLAILERSTAAAVVPSVNITPHDLQRATTSPYVTSRELELVRRQLEQAPPSLKTTTWDDSDPLVFLCPTTLLDESRRPLREVLANEEVVVSANDYVHRWVEESTARLDLLRLIPTSARNILEIGCGDGFLGETVKQRQKCRYVGIESDPRHAAAARRRIDEIYRGDVEEIASILDEEFDCVVVSDSWQWTADPLWFLASLHRLTRNGGSLVASATNASNASIVNDLLHGESPFVCAGSIAAAAARPLTRNALAGLLASAGWDVADLLSIDGAVGPGYDELLANLQGAHEYATEEFRALRHHALAMSESKRS